MHFHRQLTHAHARHRSRPTRSHVFFLAFLFSTFFSLLKSRSLVHRRRSDPHVEFRSGERRRLHAQGVSLLRLGVPRRVPAAAARRGPAGALRLPRRALAQPRRDRAHARRARLRAAGVLPAGGRGAARPRGGRPRHRCEQRQARRGGDDGWRRRRQDRRRWRGPARRRIGGRHGAAARRSVAAGVRLGCDAAAQPRQAAGDDRREPQLRKHRPQLLALRPQLCDGVARARLRVRVLPARPAADAHAGAAPPLLPDLHDHARAPRQGAARSVPAGPGAPARRGDGRVGRLRCDPARARRGRRRALDRGAAASEAGAGRGAAPGRCTAGGARRRRDCDRGPRAARHQCGH